MHGAGKLFHASSARGVRAQQAFCQHLGVKNTPLVVRAWIPVMVVLSHCENLRGASDPSPKKERSSTPIKALRTAIVCSCLNTLLLVSFAGPGGRMATPYQVLDVCQARREKILL
jgi:hypothetical protein